MAVIITEHGVALDLGFVDGSEGRLGFKLGKAFLHMFEGRSLVDVVAACHTINAKFCLLVIILESIKECMTSMS